MRLTRGGGRKPLTVRQHNLHHGNLDTRKSFQSSFSSVLRIFLALLIGFYVGMTLHVYLGAFAKDDIMTISNSENKTFTCPVEEEVHVLYTISGDNKDFLDEFSGSLKSSLLNCPLDCGMTIHIMTDEKAYNAILPRFQAIHFDEWITRNQITIKSYNVEHRKDRWQSIFEKATNFQLSKRHTIGAMFRLFAFEILPPTVNYVVYMDTDTAVLSNLGELWRSRNDTSILQWGDAKCSGFGLFNLDQMRRRDFWKLVKKAYSKEAANADSIDDQYILRRLSNVHPELFPILPEKWNLHRADTFWRWKHDKAKLVRNVPKAAMVHMNGFTEGEENEHNKFNNSYPEYDNAFWVMKYYGMHPWEWTRYILESQTRNGKDGFQTIVEHNVIE